MFINQGRDELRRYYVQAWERAQAGRTLEPLERVIADVIRLHPQYHRLFETGGEDLLDKDYLPEFGEVNPFLHMSLHVAIHEQLTTGRPQGLREHYQDLAARLGEPHAAEHRIMDCLAETLWRAQRDGIEPSETDYLSCVQRALK
jgi:Domain of unknown function (DUF1841)